MPVVRVLLRLGAALGVVAGVGVEFVSVAAVASWKSSLRQPQGEPVFSRGERLRCGHSCPRDAFLHRRLRPFCELLFC